VFVSVIVCIVVVAVCLGLGSLLGWVCIFVVCVPFVYVVSVLLFLAGCLSSYTLCRAVGMLYVFVCLVLLCPLGGRCGSVGGGCIISVVWFVCGSEYIGGVFISMCFAAVSAR